MHKITLGGLRIPLLSLVMLILLVGCGGAGSDAGQPDNKPTIDHKAEWGTSTWGSDCWGQSCP